MMALLVRKERSPKKAIPQQANYGFQLLRAIVIRAYTKKLVENMLWSFRAWTPFTQLSRGRRPDKSGLAPWLLYFRAVGAQESSKSVALPS
ncbi:hypothetical protein BH18ACI4_BH18ACI4_14070 [soil metagenome]